MNDIRGSVPLNFIKFLNFINHSPPFLKLVRIIVTILLCYANILVFSRTHTTETIDYISTD